MFHVQFWECQRGKNLSSDELSKWPSMVIFHGTSPVSKAVKGMSILYKYGNKNWSLVCTPDVEVPCGIIKSHFPSEFYAFTTATTHARVFPPKDWSSWLSRFRAAHHFSKSFLGHSAKNGMESIQNRWDAWWPKFFSFFRLIGSQKCENSFFWGLSLLHWRDRNQKEVAK